MVMLQRSGVHYLPATVIATVIAMTWNFLLSDFFLFRKQRSGRIYRRYASYLSLNVIDVVLRLPLMAVLVGGIRMPVLLATVLTTALVSAARFAALDRFVYRRVPTAVSNPSGSVVVPLDIREAA